jgi:hypothetical protein
MNKQDVMLESNSLSLLASTIAIAFAFGYILFKIYNLALMVFLNKMQWDIKELKNYTITPTLQKVDKFIYIALLIGIIWKVLYT